MVKRAADTNVKKGPVPPGLAKWKAGQVAAKKEQARAENLRQRIRGGDRDAEIEYIRRYHIDPGSIKKA